MSWVRLDDNVGDHPKVIAAGDVAFAMWVKAVAYAAKHLTDGFIPEAVIPRLTNHRAPRQVAAELVRVGLFDEVTEGSPSDDGGTTEARARRDGGSSKGFRVHDYLDWNPPAAKVRAERESERQRKAKAREKQGRDEKGQVTSGVSPPARPPGQPPDVRPESERCPTGPIPSHPLLSSALNNNNPAGEPEPKPAKPWSTDWCLAELQAATLEDPILDGESLADAISTLSTIAKKLSALSPEHRFADLRAEAATWFVHARGQRAAAKTAGEHWSLESTLVAVESKVTQRIKFRPGDSVVERERGRQQAHNAKAAAHNAQVGQLTADSDAWGDHGVSRG